MSPTARSLAYARGHGWLAQVVERWIPQARKRIDLFGIIDVVVLDGGPVLGVQCCAGSRDSGGGDLAAHREKALAEPRLEKWLLAGARFEIWSWSKAGDRGKRKVWTLRRESL